MSPGSYIAKFLHSDEFFWVEAIPEPTAVDDGPYEVDRGATLNVNGVLDNDVGVQLTAASEDATVSRHRVREAGRLLHLHP